MFLEIDRSDIRQRRMSTEAAPSAGAGDITFKLDEFALTSNNISYALSGDFLDYCDDLNLDGTLEPSRI